ncbi:unnamed protein product, partial [Cylindrotheca closterium]
MPVVGCQAFILADTGKTVSVSAYNPDYPSKQIPVVDAALLYQDRFSGEEHILVIRNALHVPSMANNLIPPFIMREHGIKVNDTAKIHTSDPSSDDHAIVLDTNVRIPLYLYGVFSYFSTRCPTEEELQSTGSVYVLTPERFDPHESSYAQREGEIRLPEDRTCEKLLLADIPGPSAVVCAANALSSLEQSEIDVNLLTHEVDNVPLAPINAELAALSTDVCDRSLFEKLSARAEVAAMQKSIGTCHSEGGVTLLDRPHTDDPDRPPDISIGSLSTEQLMEHMLEHEL